jgi:hypothetical protein
MNRPHDGSSWARRMCCRTPVARRGAGSVTPVKPATTLSVISRELRDNVLAQAVDARNVGVDRAARHPRGGSEIADADLGDVALSEQPHRGGVAILRPDKFVFALVRGQELVAATREFARQMHVDQALVQRIAPQPPMELRRWPEAA